MNKVIVLSSRNVTTAAIRRCVISLGGEGIPIIVSGPKACGKTRNAEKIAKILSRPVVVDDYLFERPLPDGCVAFTYETPPPKKSYQNFRVINFSDIQDKLDC